MANRALWSEALDSDQLAYFFLSHTLSPPINPAAVFVEEYPNLRAVDHRRFNEIARVGFESAHPEALRLADVRIRQDTLRSLKSGRERWMEEGVERVTGELEGERLLVNAGRVVGWLEGASHEMNDVEQSLEKGADTWLEQSLKRRADIWLESEVREISKRLRQTLRQDLEDYALLKAARQQWQQILWWSIICGTLLLGGFIKLIQIAEQERVEGEHRAEQERVERERRAERLRVEFEQCKNKKYCTVEGVTWVKIPANSFMMGSNENAEDETPVHEVTLKSFLISKTEVTVEQYRVCVKAGKCSSSGLTSSSKCNWGELNREGHPINCINWNQARTFAKWVGGDLCSESQWEYSARAREDFKYAGSNDPNEVAWYDSNSGSSTHPVGKKKENAWGLYDMSGNVWEWTLDEYKNNYLGAPTNGLPACSTPICGQDSSKSVFRGGGWSSYAWSLRVAVRNKYAPDNRYHELGARLCRTFP